LLRNPNHFPKRRTESIFVECRVVS
jgi:hypothetical protein